MALNWVIWMNFSWIRKDQKSISLMKRLHLVYRLLVITVYESSNHSMDNFGRGTVNRGCCYAVCLMIWWTWNVAPYAFSVSMLVLKCLIISARYKTDKGRSFSFIMPILIDFKSFKMFQNPAFPHTQTIIYL